MTIDSSAPHVVKVFLFKDSYAPFVALLEESRIEFTAQTTSSGAILQNSGTAIEILRVAIPSAAGVIIAYLKVKQSR